MSYDELLSLRLLIASLVTESGFTPRSNRSGTTDRGLAFTTTVGVIAGVHYRTTNGRTDTLVTGLTCFTNVDGVVFDVRNLTNGSLAVESDVAELAGRKSYESYNPEQACPKESQDRYGQWVRDLHHHRGGDRWGS